MRGWLTVIKNIVSGALIGIANIIPGVSGGTVALLLGVYEKLTESIGDFITSSREKKIKIFKFLFQISIGVIIGILAFAKIIDLLYKNYKEGTSFLFLGLIIGSLPLVLTYRDNEKINKYGKLWFLFGLLLMISFIFLQSFYSNEKTSNDIYQLTIGYIIKLIFSGALAGGAMVIPGISGSLLLVMLGEYYNILGFINNQMIIPIAFVGIGALIGIVGFAKIINKLLKAYRDNTLYFIIGLIVASLVEIWPGFTLTLSKGITNIIIFLLGIYIVKLMKKLERNT
ncbi:MAG TPA: DUF368 domain-containing protein [Fusobacteriaceae bacterium]|nr:DUF368 domain-containing protein [Fusobacteriaceae bacterium]